MPRCATSGIATARSNGIEIAHWLFSQTKIVGAFRIEARFAASWKIPWFEAPSPKKATVTLSAPCSRRPCAAPTAIASEPPTMASAPSIPCRIAVMCMLPPLPPQ